MEVIGVRRSRTKVKRRKADQAEELARGSEVRYPLGAWAVLATGSLGSLCGLTRGVLSGGRDER